MMFQMKYSMCFQNFSADQENGGKREEPEKVGTDSTNKTVESTNDKPAAGQPAKNRTEGSNDFDFGHFFKDLIPDMGASSFEYQTRWRI